MKPETPSKVTRQDCASLFEPSPAFQWFLDDGLPKVLAANSLRGLVGDIVTCVKNKRPVIAAIGGHVIKSGCAPIIIDLIQRGIVTAVVMNGAAMIHDVEMGLYGETSEDVDDLLHKGDYGRRGDTVAFFNEVAECCDGATSLGDTCRIAARDRCLENSIFGTPFAADTPLRVLLAIGTDTIFTSVRDRFLQNLIQSSLFDFKLLSSLEVKRMGGMDVPSAVWLNIGSAVILPEVLLKCVARARHDGISMDGLCTANLDMQKHYRTTRNVLQRPITKGRSYEIIGHHEINLPLLRMAILARM